MKHSQLGKHVGVGSEMASERLPAEPGGALAARNVAAHCLNFCFMSLLEIL
jgi:hypothetical protein